MFDIKIKTPKGAIFVAYFKRDLIGLDEVVAVVADKTKEIKADIVHGLVGHINNVNGHKIMQHLGFKIARKVITPCGACVDAKSKQSALPSQMKTVQIEVRPRNSTETVNGKIYLDISSVKVPKLMNVNITKPHWLMMVDEKTDMKWSTFYAKKSDIIEPMCERFNKRKQEVKPVAIVRCDGGGEKNLLNSEATVWTGS